jgi:hypothetical protein
MVIAEPGTNVWDPKTISELEFIDAVIDPMTIGAVGGGAVSGAVEEVEDTIVSVDWVTGGLPTVPVGGRPVELVWPGAAEVIVFVLTGGGMIELAGMVELVGGGIVVVGGGGEFVFTGCEMLIEGVEIEMLIEGVEIEMLIEGVEIGMLIEGVEIGMLIEGVDIGMLIGGGIIILRLVGGGGWFVLIGGDCVGGMIVLDCPGWLDDCTLENSVVVLWVGGNPPLPGCPGGPIGVLLVEDAPPTPGGPGGPDKLIGGNGKLIGGNGNLLVVDVSPPPGGPIGGNGNLLVVDVSPPPGGPIGGNGSLIDVDVSPPPGGPMGGNGSLIVVDVSTPPGGPIGGNGSLIDVDVSPPPGGPIGGKGSLIVVDVSTPPGGLIGGKGSLIVVDVSTPPGGPGGTGGPTGGVGPGEEVVEDGKELVVDAGFPPPPPKPPIETITPPSPVVVVLVNWQDPGGPGENGTPCVEVTVVVHACVVGSGGGTTTVLVIAQVPGTSWKETPLVEVTTVVHGGGWALTVMVEVTWHVLGPTGSWNGTSIVEVTISVQGGELAGGVVVVLGVVSATGDDTVIVDVDWQVLGPAGWWKGTFRVDVTVSTQGGVSAGGVDWDEVVGEVLCAVVVTWVDERETVVVVVEEHDLGSSVGSTKSIPIVEVTVAVQSCRAEVVDDCVGVDDLVGVDDRVGVDDSVGVDNCVGVGDSAGVDDCAGVGDCDNDSLDGVGEGTTIVIVEVHCEGSLGDWIAPSCVEVTVATHAGSAFPLCTSAGTADVNPEQR